MKIKLFCAPVLAGILIFSLCACGVKESSLPTTSLNTASAKAENPPEPESPLKTKDLVVFAAASMTETLTKLGDTYMAKNQDVNIVFNFDSSGTLKTQIQEGADVDIFISAGQKQMDQLDIEAPTDVNTDGLDFVLKGTRFNILENKVALSVPSDNLADIHSYDDMVSGLKDGSIVLAIGNSDVPVGQYTEKIFDYFSLCEDDLVATGSITYGSNVKEVTTQVSEGVVDCGIIYQTDAFSAGLSVVDTATKEMCGQVIYPAAVMNVSQNPEAAREFLEYLTSDAADAVFEEVGFTPFK